MSLRSALIGAFILSVFIYAAPAAASTTNATVQNYDSKEAKSGDTVLCPVKKEAFKVTDKSKSAKIKGKKYFVCCAGCDAELKKNADKYLTPEVVIKQDATNACAPATSGDGKKAGKTEHPKSEHPKSEHPN